MSAPQAIQSIDDWETPPGARVEISENQRKVIKDKYLRDDPDVETWLWRIARNIALAELLYAPEFKQAVLEGVHYRKEVYDVGKGQTSELLLFHAGFTSYAEWDANHRQFMKNCNTLCRENQKARSTVLRTARQFYDLMSNWDFLPNSPTLMNAGRELQQLSACYVLPIEDSIEGWGETCKNTMIIHKSGGGTGFSGCRIRPHGSMVKSTKGIASGALSAFTLIDAATAQVKQGGTRRGANMGILPYWHPDILEFIKYKTEEGKLENFNISVAGDGTFMQLAREGKNYDLIDPHTKKPVGQLNAREVFDTICQYAWKTGDPGMVWMDRINNSSSNTTPELGQIESTNPCGEQPLLPYEPCNLGSINLSKFVVRNELDWSRLEACVKVAVKFMDEVIDVNNYPLPQIEFMAKGNRRIGLGVMGWAEMLVLLGIAFDSAEAFVKAEEVMSFVNEKALEASDELALERGVFPFFKNSAFDKEGKNAKPYARGRPRQCARTTIAPTGTIAIAAGLQGSGIEPFFGIAYVRYNAKGLDSLKKGETPFEGDVFYEVNPLFKSVAEQNKCWGCEPKLLWKKIQDNHCSVRGIPEIPAPVQKLFASAHDLGIEHHLRVQAAFQKFTDNAVSKTINLPNSATVEDVRKAYLTAWDMGCKGITVYRDGCKSQQVLNFEAKNKEKKAVAQEQVVSMKIISDAELREGVTSVYYRLSTGYGPMHIHIDHKDGKPFKLFTSTTPVGTEVAGLTTALGIMISKYLEAGGDVNEIRRQLNSIKSDKPFGFGPSRVESMPHAISVALTKFLAQHGDLKGQQILTTHVATSETVSSSTATEHSEQGNDRKEHCPKCYSPNIAYVSGCSGPTCFECGHSECS